MRTKTLIGLVGGAMLYTIPTFFDNRVSAHPDQNECICSPNPHPCPRPIYKGDHSPKPKENCCNHPKYGPIDSILRCPSKCPCPNNDRPHGTPKSKTLKQDEEIDRVKVGLGEIHYEAEEGKLIVCPCGSGSHPYEICN